jgi:hypothetical protein
MRAPALGSRGTDQVEKRIQESRWAALREPTFKLLRRHLAGLL